MTIASPGFADPSMDAQSCFRAVLAAMSCPGSVQTIHAAIAAPPADPATAAALLTLVDSDTPVWLDDALAGAGEWLGFHTGAPLVGLSSAAFACATRMPPLDALRAGTDSAPDSSATLVLQLAALSGGPTLMLSGPGIEARAHFAPAGLPADFVARWAANHALFPRGVDLLLCAGDRLAALPRSTRVEEG